jgi:hypothetical protein
VEEVAIPLIMAHQALMQMEALAEVDMAELQLQELKHLLQLLE